ncbi:MAG: nucleotidyltransferase domain-containing protein [Oscillospiraceae bacterium]|nr:nucleotidyltransferase domain-containing protein [Oscillospiraceae bacterium]
MESMEKIIKEKLSEIEQKENVRIIYAVESGSRAWCFASPDSDYDVRFIYVRQPRDYLRIDEISDVIEWQLDEVYDINGWDLKKFLYLLHKSNQTAFEWAQSPIVYRNTEEWQKILPILCSHCDYFNPKGAMFHYLKLAENNNKHLNVETVKLKKYFYVLRPLLACRWIEDRRTPPPILFSELTEGYLPADLTDKVNSLLILKENAPEKGEIPRVEALGEYIKNELCELKSSAENMPPREKGSMEQLNKIFYEIVTGITGSQET